MSHARGHTFTARITDPTGRRKEQQAISVPLTRRKTHPAPMQERPPEPEVPGKAKRRSFSLEYKLRILEEADRTTDHGGIGALVTALEALALTIMDVGIERALAAAEIKAGHVISLTDCLVLALARQGEGVVVTGDPDFAAALRPRPLGEGIYRTKAESFDRSEWQTLGWAESCRVAEAMPW